MPQIPKGKLKEFRDYLESHNIKTTEEQKPITWFKPIQKHVNAEKVRKFISNDEQIDESPLIATIDGYLVDGHHRWLAAKKLHMQQLPVIVCDSPLKDFLKIAHEFDHSYVKSVTELTTYGRSALILENQLRESIRSEFYKIYNQTGRHSP